MVYELWFPINISKSMPKSEQACLKLVKLGFPIFYSGKIQITKALSHVC